MVNRISKAKQSFKSCPKRFDFVSCVFSIGRCSPALKLKTLIPASCNLLQVAMASVKVQCKSTKQCIETFQAIWKIEDFVALYPKPTQTITTAPGTVVPILSKIAPIAQLRSPGYKFKTDNGKTTLKASFKLTAKKQPKIGSNYDLELESYITFLYRRYNLKYQPSEVKLEIDFVYGNGDVAANVQEAVMVPLDIDDANYGVEVPPTLYTELGDLAHFWDTMHQCFADDVLRVRATMTVFGASSVQKEDLDHVELKDSNPKGNKGLVSKLNKFVQGLRLF